MENKEKIQNISSKAVKILGIVRKLMIVLIVILAICTFVLIIGSFTDLLYNVINNNLNYYGGIEIKLIETHGFVTTSEVITLSEVLSQNHFYDLMGELLGKSFVIMTNLIVSLILVTYFQKLFKKLMEAKSPFSLELVKSFKAVFIVTTVLVAINAPLIGLIVGLALSCMYFLYKYGCELQVEHDETI